MIHPLRDLVNRSFEPLISFWPIFPIALFFAGLPSRAQAGPDCSFNGVSESCIVMNTADGTKRVKWTSDGKIVDYSFYRCDHIAEGTALRCKVRIVEDNGKVSNGVAEIGGRGTLIRSTLGNTTYLPIQK